MSDQRAGIDMPSLFSAEQVSCLTVQATTRGPSAMDRIREAGFERPLLKVGIEGYRLDQERLRDSVTARTYHHIVRQTPRTSHADIGSVRSVACSLSHIAQWHALLASAEPYAVIFEDDVHFAPSFAEGLAPALDELSSLVSSGLQVDGLWLGWRLFADEATELPRVSKHLLRVDRPFYSAHAYVLFRSGARKLLRRALPIDTHIDVYAAYCAANGFDDLCLLLTDPPLAFQRGDSHNDMNHNTAAPHTLALP